MNYKYIDSAYVKKIKKHGLEVHPFTVDNEQDMKSYFYGELTGCLRIIGSFTFRFEVKNS